MQTEFDEYFEGVELPQNLTADAKAQVKPRKNRAGLKWFLRLAPVAVAIALVIAAAAMFFPSFSAGGNMSGAAPGGNQSAGESNPGEGPGEGDNPFYSLAELKASRENPYSSSLAGMGFAKTLALASNAAVELTAYYGDGKIRVARADISLVNGQYRHDAVIYAEYADGNMQLGDFIDYTYGAERYFRGQRYNVTADYDGGEEIYKIYIAAGGIKYYLSVETSESDGYLLYLQLLEKYF